MPLDDQTRLNRRVALDYATRFASAIAENGSPVSTADVIGTARAMENYLAGQDNDQ